MSVADKYQSLNDEEHVIMRPGIYIGGHLPAEQEMFLSDIDDVEDNKIIKKTIMYNAGMLRIFEEILLNAFDHTIRDSTCTEIKVAVDKDEGLISVMNNGSGIPVVKKEELGIYIPEMLFGKLRSGSNFDDSKKRITGGMHGMGASLTVIYSDVFMLQTVDANTKKMYTQRWEINISPKDKNGIRRPEITKYEPEIKNCRKKP
jgi:DNA topoisomerase-2